MRIRTFLAVLVAVSLTACSSPLTFEPKTNPYEGGWYYSNAPLVAGIDAKGVVTPHAPGTAKLCAQKSITDTTTVGCWTVTVH